METERELPPISKPNTHIMKTHILSTYAALQSVHHADLLSIAVAVRQVGGTCKLLPQTVTAVLSSVQMGMLIELDVVMDNDKSLLDLTH